VQKKKLDKNQRKYRTQIKLKVLLMFFVGAKNLEVNRHEPAFTVSF